jgi:2,4-dienoyl-CoA reductase-like NADH-dependent reductase (Old Yellow Enzyme family)
MLFDPIELRELTLPNRVVVSSMCHRAARHWFHIVGLALSGAGLVIMEATGVEARGRNGAGGGTRCVYRLRAPSNFQSITDFIAAGPSNGLPCWDSIRRYMIRMPS